MIVALEQSIPFTVYTHAPSTGALANADSTPTYQVYENGSSMAGQTGNLTNSTTGVYTLSLTAAAGSGYENGKSYEVRVAATVEGRTEYQSLWFQVGVVPTVVQIRQEMDSNSTKLSSLTSTASDHTDKINSIKAATDANLTGNAFTRLGAPAGASVSADIAATKAAAEAAETAAEEAGAGLKDTRDLNDVQHVWTLKRTGTGALQSTDESAYRVYPGNGDLRAGFDCNIPSICPNGTVLASMEDPESSEADITATKLGIGPNGTKQPILAKVELDIAADTEPGTYWITTEVTNSLGGGPVKVFGKVIVLEEPE